MKNKNTNLIKAIEQYSLNSPQLPALIWLDHALCEQYSLSYKQLYDLTLKTSSYLSNSLKPGQRIALLLPSGIELMLCILGCMHAGITPVPLQPAKSLKPAKWQRIINIVRNCQASAVLTLEQYIEPAEQHLGEVFKSLNFDTISLDAIHSITHATDQGKPIKADDVAVLQYTSGSTGNPKGVMLTHGNIMHNMEVMRDCFGHNESTVGCCWLPLHHDMGLIGNFFQSLYLGVVTVWMSPITFIQKPINWLTAISRYRATSCGAPNFAYDLCVKKITDLEKGKLDLSSWRLACVGAEPVRYDTLHAFAQKFETCGFHYGAFFPSYGLAETTLVASASVPEEGPVGNVYDAKELRRNFASRLKPDDPLFARGRQLISSGLIRSGQNNIIVDPETREVLDERSIGEIWVSSPSVSPGYWDNDASNSRIFAAQTAAGSGHYLRTGDLGFIDEGRLYISGRLKDLVILNGLNYAPQDIEHTTTSCSDLFIPDSAAAFSVDDGNAEKLVLIQEISRGISSPLAYAELIEKIYLSVADVHEVEPFEIVLIQAASLPKTSNGKIRRQLLKQQYLSGDLKIKAQKQFSLPEESLHEPSEGPDLTDKSIEDVVRNFWSAILRVPEQSVMVTDSLYEHGGTSIKVSQLVVRLQELYGVDIPLDELYDCPSVDTICRLLRQAVEAGCARSDEGRVSQEMEEGVI